MALAKHKATTTMSTHLILPTFLSFALVLACKSKQETTQDSAAAANSSASEQAAPTPVVAKTPADSLVLSIERTPCFGKCKAYRLNVYSSGYATYEGRSNVEKEGMHQAHIGRDTVMMILHEAERIAFFELDDVYDSQVTDLPSTVIRIAVDERDKRVYGRVDMPAKFRAFAEYIEELLIPVAWKPIPPQH